MSTNNPLTILNPNNGNNSQDDLSIVNTTDGQNIVVGGTTLGQPQEQQPVHPTGEPPKYAVATTSPGSSPLENETESNPWDDEAFNNGLSDDDAMEVDGEDSDLTMIANL
ncbi:hypothetical protein BGX29_001816 [Mortierella sp. GBA35]|nr:hypothetical protein BGX29_001816 [Mortierella sp. GBA35]